MDLTNYLFGWGYKRLEEEGYGDCLNNPGFLGEYVSSKILGHKLFKSNHGPDAYNPENEKEVYEYLSAKIGNKFQIHDMTIKNIHRITRNNDFYMIVKSNIPVDIIEIYHVDTKKVLKHVKNRIKKSNKEKIHIDLTYNWVKKNGEKIYTKPEDISDLSIIEYFK